MGFSSMYVLFVSYPLILCDLPSFLQTSFSLKVYLFPISFFLMMDLMPYRKTYIFTTRICVIFRTNTSQSQKLIPKADLKWECPYFYSNFFYLRVLINMKWMTDQVSQKQIEEVPMKWIDGKISKKNGNATEIDQVL